MKNIIYDNTDLAPYKVIAKKEVEARIKRMGVVGLPNDEITEAIYEEACEIAYLHAEDISHEIETKIGNAKVVIYGKADDKDRVFFGDFHNAWNEAMKELWKFTIYYEDGELKVTGSGYVESAEYTVKVVKSNYHNTVADDKMCELLKDPVELEYFVTHFTTNV